MLLVFMFMSIIVVTILSVLSQGLLGLLFGLVFSAIVPGSLIVILTGETTKWRIITSLALFGVFATLVLIGLVLGALILSGIVTL